MRCLSFILLFFLSGFGLYAQSEQIAQNYLDQGQYQKALKVYQELLNENPGNGNYFDGVITAHQQLEDFTSAEALLLSRLNPNSVNPGILIELGHNAALQQQQEQAQEYYREALAVLDEKPNYTYTVARSFEKYSLLDYAAEAYQKGLQLNPEMKFQLPLARIYGEQGKLEKMFSSYLDLIEKEPEISTNLVREFDRYIMEDASNPANSALRKLLLQRLQKNPLILYNEMLAWLFIQQKEFKKAFAQEKAIYRRGEENLQRIIQLTVISKSEGDLETAKEILEFIIAETPSENILLQARQLLLSMQVETAIPKDYTKIEKNFEALFQEFGTGAETLSIQIDHANFLAFKMGKIQSAIELLQTLSDNVDTNFQQAAVKMALADILVLDQKFNKALIYYSQIQNLVKNDEIAQKARFKVAQTSYFKGDFEWAKTQLDVLKASTTQLIANDAMELSLLISENALEDSTQTALKLYAKADLLSFQKKNKEGIAILDKILANHKGEKIEDEALLKQALLHEVEGEYAKAEKNYLKILEFYSSDILADNATFQLAELYRNKLDRPEKARDYYEQIIFNFPASIYFVEARKNFRMLRGDAIE
ncbi:tetratricopeptide repeat protein [Gillisia limnaea]|uniref:Tetratricopeptide TPR_2 repeat-containing protein n=1 Tax=Gillisia limnaea (strain DSM 15749 / LMG 21470 / R-8282) TaxID=865937 RepID=H2BWL1_GILLR|nr:tetratricopeptide repeat protein [Gillisia limnaea]EHQ02989.1 Tetratricopeptide TPR_2 repeat-containing protein [Gillisia limnaea DSM 15749]